MGRYQYNQPPVNHDLKKIYENYGVTREVDFVREFFQEQEISNIILESCGEKPQIIEEIHYEYPVRFGLSSLRADCFVTTDKGSYYFEVMSMSNKGKWDQEHHQQFFIKHTKLKQIFEDVRSFAIGFGEFESCFVDEICNMENTFAVELNFNDYGYNTSVYCKEQKQEQLNKDGEFCREFWSHALPELKKHSSVYANHNPTQNQFISGGLKKVAGINSVIGKSFVRLEVYLDRLSKEENKELFDKLLMNKDEIENELGLSLKWEVLESKKSSRISLQSEGNFTDKDQWVSMIGFLCNHVDRFEKTFGQYL